MRDIIWTLIVVWLIYKLIDVFKAMTAKKSYVENPTNNNPHHSTQNPKKDLHGALKNHLNKEGEYVDFEEIK